MPFLSSFFSFLLVSFSSSFTIARYSFSLFLSFPVLSLSLSTPPHPSAHVDMSTMAFDLDPLDLDAEEPPEPQGDPRSPKGSAGSVTSPQGQIHRLPFFKKVKPSRGPRHYGCFPSPPPFNQTPPTARSYGPVLGYNNLCLSPLAPLTPHRL